VLRCHFRNDGAVKARKKESEERLAAPLAISLLLRFLVTDFDAYARSVQLDAGPRSIAIAVDNDTVIIVMLHASLHAPSAVANLLAHTLGTRGLRNQQRTGAGHKAHQQQVPHFGVSSD
jgi:hypothetical protein